MKYSIKKEKARIILEEWNASNKTVLPTLPDEFQEIRKQLNALCDVCNPKNRKSDYLFDVNFGCKLYQYLHDQPWFNVRLASDDGFWRYMSICVIPNIVSDRWTRNLEDHCLKKSERIWLKNLWWYVHLTFRESLRDTMKILVSKNFSTDTIMNLVERTGKKGIYLEVYRRIMYQYSLLTEHHFNEYKKLRKYSSDNLFRAIMRLNTVRLRVIDPMLVEGGAEGYVLGLFKDFKITFNS